MAVTIRPSWPANVSLKSEDLMHEVYCRNATLHLLDQFVATTNVTPPA